MENEEKHLTFEEAATDDSGLVVPLDELVRTRIAIQANSGFGKSRALRQLYEQTYGRLQQFIFDPEGEFGSLRERFDYLLIGDTEEGADLAIHADQAAELCRRLMELRASCIFDLSALPSRTEQQRFVRLFLEELMRLPRSYWRQILIGIDEAQVFVPEKGYSESEATEAIISVAARGRKRGYCLVLAFQRLSQVHKGALAELTNRMIGRTGLDTDLQRAAKDLGMDRAQSNALKRLERGQFYVFGPAFGDDVALVRTGNVLTSHFSGVDGGQYVAPVASEAVRALLVQLQEIVVNEGAEGEPSKPVRVQIEVREVPVLAPGDLEKLEAYVGVLERVQGDIGEQLAMLRSALGRVSTPSVPVAVEVSAPSPSAPILPRETPLLFEQEKETGVEASPEIGQKISAPQQAILNSLMDFVRLGLLSVSRSNVAVWSGASPSSGSFTNNLGRLRTLGLIDYPTPGQVGLTQVGKGRAKSVAALTSHRDLLEAWCRHISGPQGRIVRHLVSIYPNSTDRVDLALMTGASANSGSFTNNLGHLRTLGLIDYPERGKVAATRLLFPKGLSDRV